MTNHKFLYFFGICFLVVASVFLAVSAYEKLNMPVTGNTISFSGEGKVFAKPDIGLVRIVIFSEAATPQEAEKTNSPKSEKVVNFLKTQGVAEKDIKTSEYNISPQYAYPRNEEPQIKSYLVYQELEVKIRNLDKAGAVIGGVVSVGANKVTDLRFTIDDLDKLKNQARSEAIAKAKKKANELESQLGIKLGKIVNFYENAGGFSPVFYEKALSAPSQGGAGPTLPAGENEITLNVTLTYQIK
ncbi:MAG: SIMPL domain-containing protein [Candidatus Yanofskybacteria bacterium]|nr:SIMPL domain-containing protein [Candidatus Yanofskybacteria bacterium]